MQQRTVFIAAAVVLFGVLWLVFGDAVWGSLLGNSPLSGHELVDEEGRPILVGTADADSDTVEVATPVDPDPGAGTDVEGGVRVRGRVLDLRRLPVVGANVTVAVAERELPAATTDAEGRYEIEMGARPSAWTLGVINATAPGRAGSVGVALSATSADVIVVDPILIGPAHDLDVQVVRAGRPVADARVVLAARVFGQMLPMAEGRTDADGLFHGTGVPEGRVRAFAAAEGHGRANIVITLPRFDEGPATIELTDERTLDVVVLDQASGHPVDGATVYVGDRFTTYGGTELRLLPSLDIPPTDGSGRTTVRGLGAADTLVVSAWKSGYARPNPYVGSGRKQVTQEQHEVQIDLGAHRTLRFPVVSGEVPTPAPGTRLELELQAWMQGVVADDAGATIEGGDLVVTGLPGGWIKGRAVAPNGVFAVFTGRSDTERGDPVQFEPLRSARVRVVDASGAPLVGRPLRFQGGLTFGARAVPVTDATGEALLEGMTNTRFTVFLMAPGQKWGGHALGMIDLAEEREVYELVADAEHVLTIRVRLDGEPRLPRTYVMSIGNQPTHASDIDEDPSSGTLRVRHRFPASDTPLPVVFYAEGFLPGNAEIQGGRDEEIHFDLEPSGSLVAYMTPPEDGHLMLLLETWNPEAERWEPARSSSPAGPGAPGAGPTPDGTQTFVGLGAGRYRVTDWHSHVSSEAVEVRLGGPPSEVHLDLSQSIWVTGVVVAPEGTDFRRARVVSPGETGGTFPGAPVEPDGKFRIRALRGETLTLTVRHDVLAAARPGGTVKVVAGAAPITLRLEAGNTLVFRFPASDPRFRGAQVRLFDAGDGEDVLLSATAVALPGGGFEIGGFAPGRYRIWVDGFAGAPVRLTKDLAAGATDLGVLDPGHGSAIVVKLLLEPGADRPRVWATAAWQGTPGYGRSANSDAGAEHDLVIDGMLAGTVTVTVHVIDGAGGGVVGPPSGRTYTVEVDGRTDAVVEVDLR